MFSTLNIAGENSEEVTKPRQEESTDAIDDEVRDLVRDLVRHNLP